MAPGTAGDFAPHQKRRCATSTLAPWLSADRSFSSVTGPPGASIRFWSGVVETDVNIGFRLEAPTVHQGPGVDGVEAETIDKADGFDGRLCIVARYGKARAVRSVGGPGQLRDVMGQDVIERFDDVDALEGVLVTVLSPAAISMFAFRGAKARWHPRRSDSSRFSEDDCTKCPKMAARRMMM
jgi:hypothetical protein